MSRDQSPVLPATISLTTRGYRCGPTATWPGIPETWELTSDLIDADLDTEAQGYPGVVALQDSALAVYLVDGSGAPFNVATLQALSDQLAADFYAWRLLAFDTVYNGIVAPPPDGYLDSIVWAYRADEVSTRIKSAPLGTEPENYNHSDNISLCRDAVLIYDPSAMVVSGVTQIPKELIALEQGRLVTVPEGYDAFSGCCTGMCSFAVQVVDACAETAVSGVTIVIKDGAGTVLCSGTTDGSGIYSCTTPNPALGVITATVGSCSYTGNIYCGVPLTLYYNLATVTYEAVDDGGGNVSGITFVASPNGSTILSMTGGVTPGGCGTFLSAGSWSSTTAGTVVFCFFNTFPAITPLGCTSPSLGTISVCQPGPCSAYDDAYWKTCDPTYCVPCDDSSFNPVFYRRSLWNFMPWSACGCQFLPKKLYSTYLGPAEILGADAGVSLELDWDETSWDGDVCGQFLRTVNGLGEPVTIPNTMVYRSSCHSNRAGTFCYFVESYLGQE